MDIQISQIITQILGFLLVLWIMKRFGWKPFLAILEKRREHIQSQLQSIESKQQELKQLLDAQKKREQEFEMLAKKTLEEAAQKGLVRAKKIEEEAQRKAEQQLKQAEELLAFEKKKLKTEMQEQMVQIASLMAESMIKEKMNSAMQDRALEETLKKVSL